MDIKNGNFFFNFSYQVRLNQMIYKLSSICISSYNSKSKKSNLAKKLRFFFLIRKKF